MMDMRIAPNLDTWTSPALLGLPWFAHGVSRRTGGVSVGPFDSLNLGLHVSDDIDSVRENRRRLADAAGFAVSGMVCAEQVHGGAVAVVRAEDAGRGAAQFGDALLGVDALVTDVSGVLLTLFYADCVPIIIADPARHTVAVAHAGWRGLVEGVVGNTVAAMREDFGSEPASLLAAVGPCIGPCCFEVGAEVAERFPSEALAPRETGGKPHVDLPAAAARHLREAGLFVENITVAGECTSCLPDLYFSHRRDNGRTGRIAAFAGVRKPG